MVNVHHSCGASALEAVKTLISVGWYSCDLTLIRPGSPTMALQHPGESKDPRKQADAKAVKWQRELHWVAGISVVEGLLGRPSTSEQPSNIRLAKKRWLGLTQSTRALQL